MLRSILVVFFAIIAFLFLIMAMAKRKHSKYASLFFSASAIISGMGGFILYGHAFSELIENMPLAILNTLFATLKMFLVSNDFSSIKEASIMQYDYIVVLFWVLHLLALYTTANAMLTTLGAPLLHAIKIRLSSIKKKIVIIFGITPESINYSKEIEGNCSIIFIDSNAEPVLQDTVREMGHLCYLSDEANYSHVNFLKNIGINKKKQIQIYAIGRKEAENYAYVMQLKDSLKEMEIESEQTSLTLMANMEMPYGFALQAYEGNYGYGSVMVVDRAYITAHTLVTAYPPCNYVQFDKKEAKAKDGECFTAVIVGFGRVGQAIFKELVKSGQFQNAGFKVVIFDPNFERKYGYLYKACENLLKKYDVSFEKYGGQAKEFYQYLEENVNVIDYITVCTGSSKENNELATEIQSTLNRLNGYADVFQCSYNNIVHQHRESSGGFDYQVLPIYTKENLDVEYADQRAIHLNHIYYGGESAAEDWNKAGFVERMSCRASADFAPAFLKMTGLSEKEILEEGKWEELSELQLENLSRTEHLRWCAFHYSIGYSKMTDEIFEERCNDYLAEKEAKGSSRIRIQKDLTKHMHLCLVDWEELDALSEKYRSVTGDFKKDYKQDDTNNVLMLPKILQTTEQE